jgi:hypothetical protein
LVKGNKLILHLRGKYRGLEGERLFNRVRQLARVIGRDPVIE